MGKGKNSVHCFLVKNRYIAVFITPAAVYINAHNTSAVLYNLHLLYYMA